MAVCFMGWLQCTDTLRTADSIAIAIGNDVIAPLRHEEFTLFRAEIAPGAGVGTPTNDCRNNALRAQGHAHALSHGGAIG
jgi:hypothetical protein